MKLQGARLFLIAAAALGPGAAAAAPLVGPAAGYNLFVLGDASLTQLSFSDSAGSIAVGGSVQLNGYSVASQVAGNTSAAVNPARLVAGGDVSASNGGIGSNASSPPQNGAIYAGGTVSLGSFTANGGVFGQTLVDFGAAALLYQSASQAWSGLAANGTSLLQFGSLTLTGASAQLNVFDLSGTDLTGASTVNIAAPAGSTVLINVSGSGSAFQNGQVFLSGIAESRVLYNFYEATTLSLPGSKNPQGTVLAPFAAVSGGFGAFDGQLIAASFSGNTEFHMVDSDGGAGGTYFDGELPLAPVPLPASLPLLLSGLGAIAWRFSRRSASS